MTFYNEHSKVEVVYLPAEKSDVVLARGCRTRHLQYSTEIEVVPDISVCQEKMSITELNEGIHGGFPLWVLCCAKRSSRAICRATSTKS